jgi:hypothetical protein
VITAVPVSVLPGTAGISFSTDRFKVNVSRTSTVGSSSSLPQLTNEIVKNKKIVNLSVFIIIKDFFSKITFFKRIWGVFNFII